MVARPVLYTPRSASHEPVDGEELELWEGGPRSNLHVVPVVNQ
jgi:hypothetical protein